MVYGTDVGKADVSWSLSLAVVDGRWRRLTGLKIFSGSNGRKEHVHRRYGPGIIGGNLLRTQIADRLIDLPSSICSISTGGGHTRTPHGHLVVVAVVVVVVGVGGGGGVGAVVAGVSDTVAIVIQLQ